MITVKTERPNTVDDYRSQADNDGVDISTYGAPTVFGAQINAMHISGALMQNSQEFAVSAMGAEHDYANTLFLDYEDEPDDAPAWGHEERHAEFGKAMAKAFDLPENEPVKFFVICFRSSDFSVGAVLLEADGDVHDLVSYGIFNKTLATTVMLSDHVMGAMTEFVRVYWGKAWEPRRCHHNKIPGPGMNPMLMELDDDDADD